MKTKHIEYSIVGSDQTMIWILISCVCSLLLLKGSAAEGHVQPEGREEPNLPWLPADDPKRRMWRNQGPALPENVPGPSTSWTTAPLLPHVPGPRRRLSRLLSAWIRSWKVKANRRPGHTVRLSTARFAGAARREVEEEGAGPAQHGTEALRQCHGHGTSRSLPGVLPAQLRPRGQEGVPEADSDLSRPMCRGSCARTRPTHPEMSLPHPHTSQLRPSVQEATPRLAYVLFQPIASPLNLSPIC